MVSVMLVQISFTKHRGENAREGENIRDQVGHILECEVFNNIFLFAVADILGWCERGLSFSMVMF